MMVFGHSGTGGGFLPGKQQVFPVDYEADVSQRLLQASSSGDLKSAFDCIDDPYVDVNFVGDVSLKVRMAEVHCRDESENVVRFEYKDFKTDVTALFVAVHTGNTTLVRKLLNRGADVNHKLFRGFSMTAAVREGHLEIFEILIKAGASQPCCEEALLEASCHGRGGKFIELLMASDMIRPHIAVHALVTACCRGFIDVVDVLLKCGIDVNASARVLLCSSKPSLHTNINCTPLVAAVVSRQVAVVRLLLQAGADVNIKVQLGAWSWDMGSGDEFRVGAGLAEPYAITWCAVEYFEATGAILQMLLQHISVDTCHNSRTLLHHAVLCGNTSAVKTLIKCGSDIEYPFKSTQKNETRPVHMAARLGFPSILQQLIESGCDINSRTKYNGETAQMICAKYKREECLRVLTEAGADLGSISLAGQSARSIAESNRWSLGFQQAVLGVIRAGTIPKSSNPSVFSALMFVADSGDVHALKALIVREEINLDEQDEKGFSAVMVTAMRGHIEAFRLLVYAGCDVKLTNKAGETAISLSKMNENSDMFEKVMIEFTLEKGNQNARGFYPLHYAARHGDLHAVKLLVSRGYDVNMPDGDEHTPLMLAAREGNSQMCEVLISYGSICDFENSKGETALSLARKHTEKEAECVILDELARMLVLSGGDVLKHTKGGRGCSHMKSLKMIAGGVLRWGNSKRRNVICEDAGVGPSASFQRCRRKKGDAERAGIFWVVTMKNKEVHFVCDGGFEMAELWVRGIKIVTGAARKQK
ncbi:serine/threonine-protein phosphatase 6 regulatory ankyrin repeat subunit A-like [Cynara cardunculus var. scolymus]|uniref:serine/threonine-protein phosphatase 6 regulatory ankyrin repeat subunit A-like n=2 Tax=Cynara cardunculus var. scolymus TaxID=59895 RepID=UPI000D62708B|nr:serine/threonine-protein phosphatase 6 regulatory ankyrin repeat subunit A-like [Cynara cardunculus var. scolymus]